MSIDQLDKKVSIDDADKKFLKEEARFIRKIKKKFEVKKEKNIERIQYLNNEALKYINNIDNRIHYWDSRRTQFLQLALGMLAASLAGIITLLPPILEVIYNQNTIPIKMVFFIPLGLAITTLAITSIGIVVLWNKQNNPSYPFTKGLRIWRWQYRYAEQKDMEIDTEIQDDDVEKYMEEIRKFQQNLLSYKEKTISSDLAELYNQNLSRIYLLITNEKFKIKFLSKLRDKLIKGLNWTLLIFVVSLLYTSLRYIYQN